MSVPLNLFANLSLDVIPTVCAKTTDNEELNSDGGLVNDEKSERQTVTSQRVREYQSLDGAPRRQEKHDLNSGVTHSYRALRYFQPDADKAGTAATYRISCLVYDPLVPRDIRREFPTAQDMLRSRVLNSTDLSLLRSVRDQPDGHGVD